MRASGIGRDTGAVLNGNGGNDLIDFGAGSQQADGGSGTDTVSFNFMPVVSASLALQGGAQLDQVVRGRDHDHGGRAERRHTQDRGASGAALAPGPAAGRVRAPAKGTTDA